MTFPKAAHMVLLAALGGAPVVAGASIAAAQEAPYGRVGNWTVTSFFADGGFAYCSATLSNGRAALKLASDGKMWQVGVPFRGRRNGIEAYYGFGMAAEVGRFDSAGDGVAVMRIDVEQAKAFASAPSFDVSIGGADYSWKLAGGTAMIGKMRECLRNRGVGSAVVAPQPPVAPPVAVAGKNCPAPGRYLSPKSTRPVEVTFFNGGTKMPVTFHWIDFDGGWKTYKTVAPQSHYVQKTYGGHLWVATDRMGNCHPEVFKADPSGNPENNNFQVWFD